MNDNPVDGLLRNLNILQGFGAKLDGDIGGITRLLSDKACGDLNSAIGDITSLTNANKLLNGILSDTRRYTACFGRDYRNQEWFREQRQ